MPILLLSIPLVIPVGVSEVVALEVAFLTEKDFPNLGSEITPITIGQKLVSSVFLFEPLAIALSEPLPTVMAS